MRSPRGHNERYRKGRMARNTLYPGAGGTPGRSTAALPIKRTFQRIDFKVLRAASSTKSQALAIVPVDTELLPHEPHTGLEPATPRVQSECSPIELMRQAVTRFSRITAQLF